MSSVMRPAALPAQAGARAFDVFNGDADGICALHQLRLIFPRDAELVTGVKRDVSLLQRVPRCANADVTVLDVSLDANAEPLRRILDSGGNVMYFDHHCNRQAFAHPRLYFVWSDAPDVCTSILVDRHLQGRFRPWAIVAAFGDNLPVAACALARDLGLDERRIRALDELGRVLNYNAYGEQVEDLHIAPQALYRALAPFVDPFDFIEASPRLRELVDGYRSDAARIASVTPEYDFAGGVVYILPCAPWARRISGVFANALAASGTARSCAVLTEKSDGTFVVSVRSAQPEQRSASALCTRFRTGGGRRTAAGINALPAEELREFVNAFAAYFEDAGGAHAC